MAWIELAEDRGQWRATVSVVISVWSVSDVENCVSSLSNADFRERALFLAVGH